MKSSLYFWFFTVVIVGVFIIVLKLYMYSDNTQLRSIINNQNPQIQPTTPWSDYCC
jgi:hypothetical protein